MQRLSDYPHIVSMLFVLDQGDIDVLGPLADALQEIGDCRGWSLTRKDILEGTIRPAKFLPGTWAWLRENNLVTSRSMLSIRVWERLQETTEGILRLDQDIDVSIGQLKLYTKRSMAYLDLATALFLEDN